MFIVYKFYVDSLFEACYLQSKIKVYKIVLVYFFMEVYFEKEDKTENVKLKGKLC